MRKKTQIEKVVMAFTDPDLRYKAHEVHPTPICLGIQPELTQQEAAEQYLLYYTLDGQLIDENGNVIEEEIPVIEVKMVTRKVRPRTKALACEWEVDEQETLVSTFKEEE